MGSDLRIGAVKRYQENTSQAVSTCLCPLEMGN